ncbi:MAG: FAD-dependent oxidoreductase [Proteobacteria bacterium]|nr:FAD-dependent oxidoreductase [Pseudomonadota bacterium]
MDAPTPDIRESRRHQMFPLLEPREIERLRRFSEPRAYAAGEALARVGEPGHGMTVILSGEVEITQPDGMGHVTLVTTHGPGAIMGELAQLSGAASLVDATAKTPVEALVFSPEKLRAVLVAEAELGERIMRALILRRVGLLESNAGGPVIVGPAGNGDVLRLQTFLRRAGQPHQSLDPTEDSCARTLVERFDIAPGQLPIVLCPNGELLRNPSEDQLARCMGLVGPLDPERTYDVAIVGAGPAGLAAAVYAGSEGLSVLALDCRAFGGQAGASARIENYLGFPTGISGMALMARAFNQAQKFGVQMAIPDEVAGLAPDDGAGLCRLRLANGETVRSRTVVVASGASYRRLDVDNLAEFEGASVHYWASPVETRLCAGQEVALVGAGNSAGQAVVYLADQVAKVTLLVRGSSLEASMSRYLVDRIRSLENVEVLLGASVCGLEGRDGVLEAIRYTCGDEACRLAIRRLFLFIGASPNTDWLKDSGVTLDPKGFVLTGAEAAPGRGLLETARPGVFAIGDVRSGSVKRVAASVGEGAQAVAAIHAFLAQPAPATV